MNQVLGRGGINILMATVLVSIRTNKTSREIKGP